MTSASTKAILSALNIAYDQKESRGFFRFQATALAMTVASTTTGPPSRGCGHRWTRMRPQGASPTSPSIPATRSCSPPGCPTSPVLLVRPCQSLYRKQQAAYLSLTPVLSGGERSLVALFMAYWPSPL